MNLFNRKVLRPSLLILVLLTTFIQWGAAQNQPLVDSLENLWRRNLLPESERLKVLKTLAEENTDMDRMLLYSEELIETATFLDSADYIVSGYLQKGNALRLKGDLSKALESHFNAAKIASEKVLKVSQGLANVAIADVYSIMENHERSINYYRSAIGILAEEKDSLNLATAILNIGDEYFNQGELDSALQFFQKSGDIFDKINYKTGVAYNMGNIGLVYAQQGKSKLAEQQITSAVNLLEELGDNYPICVYLTYMSDIYLDKGNLDAAMDFAFRSLELAELFGLKEQISDAHKKLSELFEKTGNPGKALFHFQNHIAFRDSVSNTATIRKLANQRADYEVSQKQVEVDLLNEQQRNQRLIVIIISILLALIGLLAFVLYRRNILVRRTNNLIQDEKKRSDNLLLNILPEETAHELKEFGKVKAKKFASVTVLFADFKGFTPHAERLPPEELVETIDYYFSGFDKIIEKYGLEKIKTIGDSYMAAGGLPFPTDDHALKMVNAAAEMIDFVEKTKIDPSLQITHFKLRVGINTGPLVAGVVGIKKFAYDIWGDTVNIASRMESASEGGRINISENTFQLIKDRFDCTYRGELQVKNRGVMKMYFVDGLKKQSVLAS